MAKTAANQFNLFAEEPPARRFPSRDFVKALMTLEATSPSHFLQSLTSIGPRGCSSRTSPASYPALHTSLPIRVRRKSTWTPVTDPETGKRSWSKTNTTQTKAMLSPVSWPDFQNSGMVLPAGLLTLSTSEWTALPEQFLNDVGVSSLSDILETTDVPQRYYLSPKACLGILRRAGKRGKELPRLLHRALSAVAAASSALATREDKTQ